MIDPGKAVKQSTEKPAPPVAAAPKLLAGVIFGLAFGFLLQKGGVGKFNILIGQLLLQDWTVAKIMLTAIVVGMVGVFALHHFAKVNLHIKPTRIGANIIGGLLFGAGFALMGYCPGTAAAALGQGSWDALLRHGWTSRGFVDFRRVLRVAENDRGEVGRPRQSSSAGFAARPARSVRGDFCGAAYRGIVRIGKGVSPMTVRRTW